MGLFNTCNVCGEEIDAPGWDSCSDKAVKFVDTAHSTSKSHPTQKESSRNVVNGEDQILNLRCMVTVSHDQIWLLFPPPLGILFHASRLCTATQHSLKHLTASAILGHKYELINCCCQFTES